MSGKLFSGLCAMMLGCSALGQTSTFYENSGVFLAPPAFPPNIDAVNFLNSGVFVINFTNNDTIPIVPPPAGLPPYETQNTLNYSNFFGRFMSCNTGFRLETYNSQTSQRQRAASFYNAGTINCGTIDTTNYFITREFFFGTTNLFILGTRAGSKMLVNASNIVNSGTINMGFESALSLKGSSVDLTRASVISELSGVGVSSGVSINLFPNQGVFDGYWGFGTPDAQRPLFYPDGIIPSFYFESTPPFTPIHPVTTRNQTLLLQALQIPNTISFVREEFDFSGSNRTVRAVFLGNTNANVQANVYFPFSPDIIIEYTNKLATAATNLYVFDYFLIRTNFDLLINGFANGNSTLIPINYLVFPSPSFGPGLLGPPIAPGGVPPGTFNDTPTTNQWSAYQALLQPLSVVLNDNAGQNVTNLPGRIEIIADKVLDLTRARINSLNYLALKSTNHFIGSSRAQISSPVMDINLASTNGLLAITNLLIPTLDRTEGDIKLFSARWTNVTTDLGFVLTNRYHVLFADANFSPTSPARVQELILRSTNSLGGTDSILISDVLNVTRSLVLDARRITITTNEPGAPTPAGGINVETSDIVWPNSTPRLQYFTNNGFIRSLNTVFFGGSRTSPYYGSNFNEPYFSFINSGGITNYGSLIWATNFQSGGVIFATGGDIRLQQAQSALLTTNGMLLAPFGDIIFECGSLQISNHLLLAGSQLNFTVTNLLTDTGISNANTWFSGRGVHVQVKPVSGDLRGTTILETVLPGSENPHRWAAEDRGCSPAGFTNNVALGQLILDGSLDSLFTFTGTGISNAIYVDYLDLRNFATNIDVLGNLELVQIDPNMKVYYAQAVAGGVSVAERLNGANGGRFCWVSNYAGIYSSTNLVYSDGTTNTLNIALVQSCNLDSDGDGLPNCVDPEPLPPNMLPINMALVVAVTNLPPLGALVSWQGVPNATNSVYVKSSPLGSNWQLLTNMVLGPTAGRVSVFDPMAANATRFYRVQAITQQ